MRKVRVNFDRQAIDHDRRLYPAAAITQQGFPRWPGSEAQRLMKQDVDNEVYWNITPKQLYDSRPEYYRDFELTQIREHLQTPLLLIQNDRDKLFSLFQKDEV